MLDRLIEKLNARPILWALFLGVSLYICAFWLAILGMFERFPLSFEIGFVSAGIVVMGYHWAMSRFIIKSKVAQVLQMSFGLALVSFSMMLIGAAMQDKTYQWVNRWLF